ncbi:MAG: S8 family peptidase [Verrucomicrobiales bacterium]|nr:S8 family peptidase [Verrucomicrobiales bacterium]
MNRENPVEHVEKLKGVLGAIQKTREEIQEKRLTENLPDLPAGEGLLIRLPERAEIESITRPLGMELVAETEDGFMLVATEDISFSSIYELLEEFENGEKLVAGSSLLEIQGGSSDLQRLKLILTEAALELWPLKNRAIYTFDLGVQTAESTKEGKWPSVRKKQDELEETFLARRKQERQVVRDQLEEEWLEKAEARVAELNEFVKHYEGEVLSPLLSEPGEENDNGVVFADSVQLRIQMSGEGFRDVILNFPHLFEVDLPPELRGDITGENEESEIELPDFIAPDIDAPRICVIDSGIQENHAWLSHAIDSDSSRCFLLGRAPDEVADEYPAKGHGTRVAGAVLYPESIPQGLEVEAVCWIQNARVLNEKCSLPKNLPPERYLAQVISHFVNERGSKVFVHCINANIPCRVQRMSAWAAKMDELAYAKDILFIQSTGNQSRLEMGDEPNPGLRSHLEDGRTPPEHQLEESMRVADPAQGLHALTVGSVSGDFFEDEYRRSFSECFHGPSGFSRTGFGQPWSVIKPDVVEVGGDLVYSKTSPHLVSKEVQVSVELLNATLHQSYAFSKDGAGTSFAAPKVAHIAARLQALFPDSSPLLYRALIAQSARWPQWAETENDKEKVVRLIGYGIPTVERATENAANRVTIVTPEARYLGCKEMHLFTIQIPEEVRDAATDAKIRIDVTLAYNALPRRTRSSRTGYLETWLDWRASDLGEPAEEFLQRMTGGGGSSYTSFKWALHSSSNHGEVGGTARQNGTLQKDWAVFDSYELASEFSIAVRGHKGWNHLDGEGDARYCLAVSLEVLEGELPIYSTIRALNEVSVETESRVEM